MSINAPSDGACLHYPLLNSLAALLRRLERELDLLLLERITHHVRLTHPARLSTWCFRAAAFLCTPSSCVRAPAGIRWVPLVDPPYHDP
jgi:hypothetical protein